MQLLPHSPVDGVYPASDDYVHAMEVRGAERLLSWPGRWAWTTVDDPALTSPSSST